jgi:hypothetical protein
MWTHRPTVIGGQSHDGDFTILRHGQEVGRVCPSVAIAGTSPYSWMTWTYPAASGRADSLEEALERLHDAIRMRWPDEVERLPLAAEIGK